ncbi:MAG: TetR/AcrR family transcriptional regulator [Acidobacteriaceae bacterium]|jgi:TetR/AcrR family transcriptional regulator|nr:TetR/AcrR family transcriptional regulator [Acidobacteriaceae bacterium]
MAEILKNHAHNIRADQTRTKILRAAVQEFSLHGLSGARIDAIAATAGANKALLYYYFRSKDELYAEALKSVSAKVLQDMLAALDSRFSPGERLLRSALTHFDRIFSQREFQSLMQQEMVRYRHGASMPDFFRNAFHPMLEKLLTTIDEGQRSGELCENDPLHLLYVMLGANVFYFLSAPIMQVALPFKPLESRALKARRIAAVKFLGNAVFRNRTHGNKLAQRVLDDMPMPQIKNLKLRSKPL